MSFPPMSRPEGSLDRDWPRSVLMVQRCALFVAIAMLAATKAGIAAEDITGLWLTDDGTGAIEIRPCGAQRCGHIAWMKDPKDEHGQVPMDRNNPDPNLRS